MNPTTFRFQGESYCLKHFQPFTLAVKEHKAADREYRTEIRFVTSHCYTRERLARDRPDIHVNAFGEERSFCVDRYERSKNIREVFAWASAGKAYFADEWRDKGRRFLIVKGEPGMDPLLIPFDAERARKKGVDVILNVISAYPAERQNQLVDKIQFGKMIAKTAKGEKISRARPGGRRGPGGRRR